MKQERWDGVRTTQCANPACGYFIPLSRQSGKKEYCNAVCRVEHERSNRNE